MDFGLMLEEAEKAERPRLLLARDPGPANSVAILSGSFDPLTVGHAALAEAARARADMVLLLYSVRTLAKEGERAPALLPVEDRLRAIERWCDDREGFAPAVCSHGLLADQLEAAGERFPRARLYAVVGSDKVLQLLDPKWYRDRDAALSALFARARVLYGLRAGDEARLLEVLTEPENGRFRERFERLTVPEAVAGVSSRGVRELLASGGDPSPLVPEEVRPALRPRRS